ncbi:hypothetical protein L209DRAFT_779107 [Thermothelomyces heterothallicus CBS 203.75]
MERPSILQRVGFMLHSLLPSADSFVRGAVQAWGEHLYLAVWPDEVWLTILVQVNFYMISHAEEICSLFVDHEGREEIYDEIQKRVKTDWLLDWIVPDFSTTTESDVMAANVLMMGLTQAYFQYVGKQVCGIPSVTLLGERAEWDKPLTRLDRLPEFAARLRPVLTRISATFDASDAPETRASSGTRSSTAAPPRSAATRPSSSPAGSLPSNYYWNDAGLPFARSNARKFPSVLRLDDVDYPVLDLSFAPVGYARVPFIIAERSGELRASHAVARLLTIMKDFGGRDAFPAYVAAGALGKQVTQGAPAGYEEALARLGDLAEAAAAEHATLRPLSEWMLYGPVEHNVTQPDLVLEDGEMMDILFNAKRYVTEETCGVLGEP